jgi:cyclopropane-fatty-acyl-phospholipid synthase
MMIGVLQTFLRRAGIAGSIKIVDPGGKVHAFGDGTGVPVRIRFTSERAIWNVLRHPDLNLGEEFMRGGFVVEEGSIYDLVHVLLGNAAHMRHPWPAVIAGAIRQSTRRLRQLNTPGRARRNVHAHYDLNGRLYSLFLDNDLQYSCAYFEEGTDSLDDAQLAKKRHIAAKLALEPGQRVLDIGSGWGGLGLYLAQHADVDVVGVTLSDEQYAVSNARAAERGLSDRVQFLLEDYRKVRGPFDRIVSVGMFEHVGVNHYHTFFKACRELLTPNGVMLLHSIGRYDGPGDTAAWIQRHIFPGGYIPAVSEVLPHVEKTGLNLTDIEILRLHYAETLKHWRERFLAHREEVKQLYDERFCLMWECYLASSEAAFRAGMLMNFQMQIVRKQTALPITRDYMREAETELRASERLAARRTPLKLAGE